MKNKIIDGIKGFIIGDALGVPFEFKARDKFVCTGMTGYGTYNMPPGTWSDDTSMMLATIAAMIKSGGKFSPLFTMMEFEKWYIQGEYTPYGKAFDIGNTTRQAINRFNLTNDINGCGGTQESDNGNGALMRMLPIALLPVPVKHKMSIARKAAALTHAHSISLSACEMFVAVVDNLLKGETVDNAIFNAWYMERYSILEPLRYIGRLERSQIKSSGYVIDTFEAALWCLQANDSFKGCVLSAVNLGGDTDTIAAITGGLAGIVYGIQDEAVEWWERIARREFIEKIVQDWLNILKIG